MARLKSLAAALAASTLLAGAAVAADQTSQAAPVISAQQKQTDADVGKLSTDGVDAYRDVHLARLAIYEAKPDQARMFVSHAQSALEKAKTDSTAFIKAEADLKPPAGIDTAATMAGKDGTAKGQTEPGKQADASKPAASASANSKEAVTWLPVDAQLVLADDFVARNKDQSKAVDEANQHLKQGDKKGAVDRLKLAGVDVDFTMAVVPLGKTTQGVDNAAKLIADGKYYEANATLKQVEDGVRFDVIEATAVPKADNTAATGKPETGASTGSVAKPAH
ncbi:YfdX family protein [Methylobacterium sp. WL103]|uniref:YfdX family protein n=1 Tax=unclassified Methylobacterium TaxID=2615210 RepID=UPI0011CC0F30|nr:MULTISPECIES: YfdX family protein [unclassified Methylobacterium]TXN07690.1 YfdX family protein [Methylobacterium sp. WL103]TXN79405.1 YfdX family protein [Methylobacterium sp. WL8]